jgi:hypothetical protein
MHEKSIRSRRHDDRPFGRYSARHEISSFGMAITERHERHMLDVCISAIIHWDAIPDVTHRNFGGIRNPDAA